MKKKNAFSLIELSIVILIIGILIAGVTQSSRLIVQMRLNSARTQTQSSPVTSIPGLSGWWESTSTASFDDADASDGAAVNNWYDINPTSIQRANFSATTTARPTYEDSALNGLPALTFNGTANIMTSTSYAVPTVLPFTIFSVVKNAAATVSTRRIFGFTNNGYALACRNNHITVTFWTILDVEESGTGCDDVSPMIISVAASSLSPYPVAFYKNGTSYGPADINAVPLVGSGTLAIGANTSPAQYFNGFIAEIIIYNRVLKSEERRAVEAYLGKKWGIKVL